MRFNLKTGVTMDAVMIGSILTIVGAVLVVIVLAIRIGNLMKTTHSKD